MSHAKRIFEQQSRLATAAVAIFLFFLVLYLATSPGLGSIGSAAGNLFGQSQAGNEQAQPQTAEISFSPSVFASDPTAESINAPELAQTGLETEFQTTTNQLLWLNNQMQKEKNPALQPIYTSQMKEAAEKRKKYFEELVGKNPELVWAYRIHESDYSQFALEIRQKLETKKTLEGTIETLHFDGEKPRFEYFLKTRNQRIQIFFAEEQPALSSGTKIQIEGYQLENKMLVFPSKDNLKILTTSSLQEKQKSTIFLQQEPSPIVPSLPETLGEQKTAVILVRLQDSPPDPPFTKQQIYDTIFNGTFQQFFKENSFNKLWFTGNVFGWYTANQDSIEDIIAASDGDIFFPNYQRIIVLLDDRPREGFGGWGTIGKWDLTSDDGPFRASVAMISDPAYFFEPVPLPSGGQRSYEWTAGLWLLTHEVTHGLDVSHANNWECGPDIRYGDCEKNEYGNFFDNTGSGYRTWGTPLAALHVNALFKKRFNWIGESSILKIVQNGTYSLKPLEKPSAVIAEIKKAQYPQIPPYYLEYRIPFGFDDSLTDPKSISNLDGIFVNKASSATYWPPGDPHTTIESHLLDTTPTTNGRNDDDWYEVTLNQGHEFNDSGSGVKITNIKEDISDPDNPRLAFSVALSEPQCVRKKPHFRFWDTPTIEARAGDIIELRGVLVRNADSDICPISTFNLGILAPNGWEYFVEPQQFKLSPNDYFYFFQTFTLTVPSNAVPGDYQVAVTAKNLGSGLESTAPFTVRVVPGCDPGWQYFSQTNQCVFNGYNQHLDFSKAQSFCQSNGGWLPSSAELQPICGELVLRPGEQCHGFQCMGSVRVSDPFASGHKTWHDKGFHFENQACGQVVYDYCGTQYKNPSCQMVEGWIQDNRTDYGFVCLKNPA